MAILGPSGLPLYIPPAPNILAEERVNRELQDHYDPLLFIQWAPQVVWNGKQEQWEGRYALMCRWGHADPRRAEQLPPDAQCDRLAWFTEKMQDGESEPVEPDQMLDRVVELLAQCDNTKYPWLQKFRDTWAHNEQVKKDQVSNMLDMTEDEARHWFNKVKGNASISVPRSL